MPVVNKQVKELTEAVAQLSYFSQVVVIFGSHTINRYDELASVLASQGRGEEYVPLQATEERTMLYTILDTVLMGLRIVDNDDAPIYGAWLQKLQAQDLFEICEQFVSFNHDTVHPRLVYEVELCKQEFGIPDTRHNLDLVAYAEAHALVGHPVVHPKFRNLIRQVCLVMICSFYRFHCALQCKPSFLRAV